MVALPKIRAQGGMTLIELLIATAIGAILLAALDSLVKIGLDTQVAVRGNNELAYQGRFALQRMTDKALTLAPKTLATPAANTSGNWFAPSGCTGAACVMYCRKASSNQLIETTTADTGCTGTTVIANNVTAFAAQLPSGASAAGSPIANLSLTLSNDSASLTLARSVRLGGGTQ